jgi:hypothetical protein
VDKDTGMLLAQIVPILALAVGLEIRSLGPRLTRPPAPKAKAAADRPLPVGTGLLRATFVLVVTALTALGALGALQIQAIGAATGIDAGAAWLVLVTVIAITFLTPYVQGIAFYLQALDLDPRRPVASALQHAGVPFIALLSLGLPVAVVSVVYP